MEEYTNPEIQDEEILEEEELSLSDKIIGVFTQPMSTFKSIVNFDLKFIDWFLPYFLFLIIQVSSQFIVMTNPEIRMEINAKSMELMQPFVDSGQMTEADVERQMEMGNSTIAKTLGVITGVIGGFIMFFIISGLYFIIAKFILKGDGSYTGVMIAFGLTSLIILLQQILLIIASLAAGKHFTSFSLTTLLGMDIKTIEGFALSFFEPFKIAYYIIFSIALGVLFKSADLKKYIITVISIWIGFSAIFFVAAQSFPFLNAFIQ